MNRYQGVFTALLSACLASATLHAQQPPAPPPQAQQSQPQSDPHLAEEQAAQRQALGFLGYLDQGRFAESYAYTGMLIRAQVDQNSFCLLYTSDAADDLTRVDLGGRRIIK